MCALTTTEQRKRANKDQTLKTCYRVLDNREFHELCLITCFDLICLFVCQFVYLFVCLVFVVFCSLRGH